MKDALQTLHAQLYYHPIVEEILPKEFSLTEYTLSMKPPLEGNLTSEISPKKLAFLGFITKLNEKRNIGPHRAPFLDTFNKKKYSKALELGLTLVWTF